MEAIFCTFQSTKNCKCLKTGELLKNVNPTHGTTIFTHQSSFLRLDIPAHMKYLALSQEIPALSKNTKRCQIKKKNTTFFSINRKTESFYRGILEQCLLPFMIN